MLLHTTTKTMLSQPCLSQNCGVLVPEYPLTFGHYSVILYPQTYTHRPLYQVHLASTSVVFCCCSPSASRFDMLCVQRCSSAYLSCNEFELLWPFYLNCRSLDIFSFSDLSLSTLEMVVPESPSRSAGSEILRPARLDQQPCHLQSHLNHLSSPF